MGAIEKLQAGLEMEPENDRILTRLGEVFYYQRQVGKAEEYLLKARALSPKNSRALVLLGLVYEQKSEVEKAISTYKNYTAVNSSSSLKKLIETRLGVLVQNQMKKEKVLESKPFSNEAAISEDAIAIAPFQFTSEDSSLKWLPRGLTNMMITDLSKVKLLTVLERSRIAALVEELKLGTSGTVGMENSPRLGRLLRAGKVLQGNVLGLAAEQVRLDVQLVNTHTGEVNVQTSSGSLERILRVQKDLTFKIIDGMGIVLSSEERDQIEKIPTESILAFMAYSQGLALADQGVWEEALLALEQATLLDPKFDLAEQEAKK